MSSSDWSSLITPEFLQLSKDGQWAMFNALAKPCELSFPARKTPCPNCVYNPITGRSSYVVHTGSTSRVQECPMCTSTGFLETINTSTVNMQLNWSVKGFIDAWKTLVLNEAPKTFVQSKCKFTDLPQILQCVEAVFLTDLQGLVRWKFKRRSEAQPCGITQSDFAFLLWERIA